MKNRDAKRLGAVLTICSFVIAVFAMWLVPHSSEAVAFTRVSINGQTVPVSFNDGDSFRPHRGPYQGVQCRLSGFNTLESFGPAHQWGSWHPYELYGLAKRATRNGIRGNWHCTTDGTRDGYGRLLLDCPDLAISQISQGLATAYQVDDTPARPEYLRAQSEAQAEGRGIWAHGIPEFIMTSVHSANEPSDRTYLFTDSIEGTPEGYAPPVRFHHYNRLISTRDGHTEQMAHGQVYSDCEWVCNQEATADSTLSLAVARQMRLDPTLAPQIAEWSNLLLTEAVVRYVRRRAVPEYFGASRDAVTAWLAAHQTSLPPRIEQVGACMLYLPFERHYGRDRASCLNGHGTVPPHRAVADTRGSH